MGENKEQPKVSCLMITADRKKLAKRSLLSYRRQVYANKELIVLDDGAEDYTSVFNELSLKDIKYVKMEKKPKNILGYLRNLSLKEATGDFITQWDDDDWYHPDRIQTQVDVLLKGNDACCLSHSLMHIDKDDYFSHPFIGFFKKGIPGSIMHRKDPTIHYPLLRRKEDDVYLRSWAKKRFVKLPISYSHMMIRCFHGSNTWEQEHFKKQMVNTIPDLMTYVWHRYFRRDLFSHQRFKLNEKFKATFDMYLKDSREAELFQNRC